MEIPIYLAAYALTRTDAPELPAWMKHLAARVVIAFGASLVTHPIVWFLIPRLGFDSYWSMVAVAEAFAVVAEGFYFTALGLFDLRRAMLVALLANAASASLGLASRAMWGWP